MARSSVPAALVPGQAGWQAGRRTFCPHLRCDTSDSAPGVPRHGEGEMCSGRGSLLGQPAFRFSSFLPSAREDVLAPRTCSSSSSVRIRAATAGEAAGKSWNAVLQLGAPQHCLLHVQRPALLCQPGHLCIPPAVLSPRSSRATLGGAGGWWHSRHSAR